MTRKAKRIFGFSLIEMMVTVAVVGVGVTAVLVAISGTLRAESRVERRAIAQDLLRLKTDEFSGTAEPMSARKGRFEPPFDNYNWRVEVQATRDDGLHLLKTEISWKGQSRTVRVRGETLVPQR